MDETQGEQPRTTALSGIGEATSVLAAVMCSSGQELPRIFTSYEDLMTAARALAAGETLRASDCRALALMREGDSAMWISSPNMDFVPEVPTHSPDHPFSYFRDGMLGAFERFKWPQAYDVREPHGMATPGHPGIMGIEGYLSFPPSDCFAVLPRFADVDVPWITVDASNFRAQRDLPMEEVGFLRRSLVRRFEESITELGNMVLEVSGKRFPAPPDPEPNNSWRIRGSLFPICRMQEVRRACSMLKEVPLSTFETVMWVREVQRLILELRAWVIYTDIIVPRLDDHSFNDPHHVLPVWYVRPLHTLTTATRIVQCVMKVLPWRNFFSGSMQVLHGIHQFEASQFDQACVLDHVGEDLAIALHKYSMSSKPMLRKMNAVSSLDDESQSSAARDADVVEDDGGDFVDFKPLDWQDERNDVGPCAEQSHGETDTSAAGAVGEKLR